MALSVSTTWCVPLPLSAALESRADAWPAQQMKRPKLKGCDLETLERIVRDNAKQRFSMRAEPTGEDGADELWIRANQGHSVKVRTLSLFLAAAERQGQELTVPGARRSKPSSSSRSTRRPTSRPWCTARTTACGPSSVRPLRACRPAARARLTRRARARRERGPQGHDAQPHSLRRRPRRRGRRRQRCVESALS